MVRVYGLEPGKLGRMGLGTSSLSTFAYDGRNRLLSTTDPLGKIERYTYDGNDNLETATESVASGTDPPSASLVTTRTYDAFDRLSSQTEGLAQGGTRTLGYDYYGNGLR